MTRHPTKLVEYPYVVLRVACDQCKRFNAYRIARLGAAYGGDISLDDLMDRLFFDCPWRLPGRLPRKYEARCLAYLRDLHPMPRPPDLPPGMAKLHLVHSQDLVDGRGSDQPEPEPSRKRAP